MTFDEVRKIKEMTSLATIGMTTEELRLYFDQGATDMERRIAEIRKKRGIELETVNNSGTSNPFQKKEHGFIRGAEYYVHLTTTKTEDNAGHSITVNEPAENYDSNE
jgi:hypothetical protein